ncbi:hypothetical protein QBC39DRAFT_37269 [Podospora conica]|nr:hypothetical protein QBC39DRAFT_37269 [Schizothecium conicum]
MELTRHDAPQVDVSHHEARPDFANPSRPCVPGIETVRNISCPSFCVGVAVALQTDLVTERRAESKHHPVNDRQQQHKSRPSPHPSTPAVPPSFRRVFCLLSTNSGNWFQREDLKTLQGHCTDKQTIPPSQPAGHDFPPPVTHTQLPQHLTPTPSHVTTHQVAEVDTTTPILHLASKPPRPQGFALRLVTGVKTTQTKLRRRPLRKHNKHSLTP